MTSNKMLLVRETQVPDEILGWTSMWTPIKELRGSVFLENGSDGTTGEKESTTKRFTLHTQWFNGLLSNDRIMYRGQYYDIITADNMNEANAFWAITAEIVQ